MVLFMVMAAVVVSVSPVFDGSSALGKPEARKLPPVYDTKADGEKQIADALARAKWDHKRVLLQFGANWCIWCHRLHDLFKTDPAIAKLLASEYELVLIDVDEVDGERHNATLEARLGRPTKNGLPVLVVLDDSGRPLTTINTEPLEQGDHYNAPKVLATLKKWKAKPASADARLSSALAEAKAGGKNVFLYFTAPWCRWCKRMDAYVLSDAVGTAFCSAYVPVKVDVERMSGGSAMSDKYGRKEDDGVPFFVLLDAGGKKLADSRAPQGNIGFPAESFEIAHFMKVIKAHGKSLADSQLSLLEKGLKKKR